ncbi:hypothetical protein JCM33374_g3193 [Metschnikowia sp. JCM 33374]|nr:hypothetical protein JCM33374_g3193 [Metschnikowia sp. JCM 33374]
MPENMDPPVAPSISTSANVHIVNDPTSSDTDAVSVSMELFVRLFPHSQRALSPVGIPAHFVLMKFIGVPDFFPRFNIYKISSIDDTAPTPASVTITNHCNFVKFGANLTFHSCVIQSIDAKTIPPLDRVFINVPDAIYDILNASPEESVKQKFISEYISPTGGILAQGDTIRSLNASVCLCEPFYQGRVTPETSLVFVKKDLSEIQVSDSIVSTGFHAIDPNTLVTDTQDKDLPTLDIDLSEYLSKSIVFGEDTTDLPSSKYMLNVLPLPHRISVPQVPFAAEDPELYAFLSTRDLAKLGFPVFNGDLVEFSIFKEGNEQSDINEDRIIVKLFTFLEPNNSFREDTLYLSPLLLVNLSVSSSTHARVYPHKTPSRSISDAIPTAKTATISRVVSPITMDKAYQRSFFAELKTTFHTQHKCFRAGDMFPVSIDSVLARAFFEFMPMPDHIADDDETQNSEIVPTGNPDSVAWFKVVEISGGENTNQSLGSSSGQFRIDPSKTSLTSSGVEFVGVPPNRNSHWNEYLKMPPLFNFFKAFSGSPTTFKYARDFYQVLETNLRSVGRTDLRANILLHSMTRSLGKTTLVRSAALDLGINLIEIDAIDVVRPGAELKSIGLLSGKIEKQLAGQLESSHCDTRHILYIKHIENLCTQVDPNEQGASTTTSLSFKVVNTIQEIMRKYSNMVLVVSSNDIDKVSDSLRQILTFEIAVTVPSEPERLAIIDFFLDIETRASNTEDIPEMFEDKVEFNARPDFDEFRVEKRQDIKSRTLALQSAGLTPLDLMSIMRKTKQSATLRLIKYAKERKLNVETVIKIGNGGSLLLIPEDFEKAINDARNQFSDSIGAPRIPNVKWEDIGGLDLVKDEILDTIDLPLKHPELFSNGLKKRSGILFYGPPGTGKTLLAKAIATNFSLNFFSVKGPELLNMYIGESEANVRRVFQRARDAKPCVIFFDELDSVAPKRGNQGDSGGVMDRIVSQLLAELDGMSGGENSGDGVFVVGATNRPDLLDEALLRPGRFDKMLYLGISDTNDKQTKILEALTRKFKLGDDVDLPKIAERCSFTLTGADFYALCSDSMLNAMTRTANKVDIKLKEFNRVRLDEGKDEVSSRWWFDNAATAEDIDVLVTMEDFQKAQSELAPSVSAEELAHYLRVKENFEGGKKKAQEASNLSGTEIGQPVEMNGRVYVDGSESMNGKDIIINAD